MSDDDDAHNVIVAYALFFVAERTERVKSLRRERRAKEKELFYDERATVASFSFSL